MSLSTDAMIRRRQGRGRAELVGRDRFRSVRETRHTKRRFGVATPPQENDGDPCGD